MRWSPYGYGGERRPPEQVKREGWREQGVLVIAENDHRLTWPEREMIRQLAACRTRDFRSITTAVRLPRRGHQTAGGAPITS